MKKNRFIHITNWILLFSIPFMLLTVNVKTDVIKSSVDTKNLNTSLFEKIVETTQENKELTVDTEEVTSENEVVKEEKILEEKQETTQKEEVTETEEVVQQEETPVVTPEVTQKSDVIETYTGNLSYYRANCSGCSGYTATGYDVRDGKLYYNDLTYGNIRIVAAGTEIPKYSIVRIKNSSLGTDVLAIVLDRGGNIGQGKKFIVDILTNSTEAKGGIDYGVSIEVIRKGK